MHKPSVIQEIISEAGLLPLFFHPDKETSKALLLAVYEAGVRAVEYTNRGPQALDNFSHLRAYADDLLPGLQLGIGTIKDAKAAKAFLKAGADFVISPGLEEAVGEITQKAHRLWIPGCMTVTEIMRAEAAGAKMIKLFPGNLLGPSFVSAIKEIFPGMQFMPTGGVELEKTNLEAWFGAGVVAVGMGSRLFRKDQVEAGNFAAIRFETKLALDYIKEIKHARKNR